MGPRVRVIATSFDRTGGTVAVDDAIQISFDRYLLPSTALRQGFALGDNTNKVLPPDGVQTIYDPVARTITITGPRGLGTPWLTEGLEYKLLLFVPPNDETDQAGFRAIDRAPLDRTYTYVFTAGPAKKYPVNTPVDPAVNFCADVLPIFTKKCGDATCHGAPPSPTGGTQPASSLILNTSSGVRVTAVGRVAQGANTGGSSFDPVPAGRVFGVDMALVEKGNPGASWLMYKIEMAPHPVIDAGPSATYLCTPPSTSDAVTTPGGPYVARANVAKASDEERERLADYILGRYMPYPSGSVLPETQPLTFEEREAVRRWIAQGAETPECGGCGAVTPPPDAGAGDADAGDDDAGDAGADAEP